MSEKTRDTGEYTREVEGVDEYGYVYIRHRCVDVKVPTVVVPLTIEDVEILTVMLDKIADSKMIFFKTTGRKSSGLLTIIATGYAELP